MSCDTLDTGNPLPIKIVAWLCPYGIIATNRKSPVYQGITSWQCDSRIADAEFLFAKNQYIQKTGRVRGEDDVIAYHLRQSFVPGEITPEEANRLGCELAKRFTKGNHAYIVCTHIDKAHIHNHVIWNSTALTLAEKAAAASTRFNDLFAKWVPLCIACRFHIWNNTAVKCQEVQQRQTVSYLCHLAAHGEFHRAISHGTPPLHWCADIITYISGFAIGVDLLFAEIVAKRIANNPALKLIAAIPYQRQLDTLKKSERTKALMTAEHPQYASVIEIAKSIFILQKCSFCIMMGQR